MLFVGYAAALMMRVSDNSDTDAMLAKLRAARDAYANCVLSQAAATYHGQNTDELGQAILAACQDKFEAWLSLGAPDGSPEIKAAAAQTVQPMLLATARLALQAQAARQAANPQVRKRPTASGAVSKRAPVDDDRAPAQARPPAAAGPCGGISVPTDPSALSCSN